jgi:antitoxin HicB
MSYHKLPLVLLPQPEGGYTVTCPLLPELITEGDTLAEVEANAADAFAAVLEIYREAGRELPSSLRELTSQEPLLAEILVELP